jgi:phage/plasmid-associated DNA primase
MSNPAQIERASYDAMLYGIQKASIYNKPEFQKTPLARAEQKMLAMVQAVAKKERQDYEDEDRYTLPAGMTIEEHLFNLTFKADKQRPIKVIDYVFRKYNPEYGYWEMLLDEDVEKLIIQNARKAHYPPNKDGVAKSLATVANVEKTMKWAAKVLFCNVEESNNKHLVAFKNVTVSTKTGQATEHSPDNNITTCLPYDYKPNSPCPPRMLEYIRSSFGKGTEEYVRACLGLILDMNAPKKFIHVIGASGSGKGVFIHLLMKLFGKENVASPNDFSFLGKPETIHQTLSGKRLVVFDDVLSYVGSEVARFYTSVEDTGLDARCLFKARAYTRQFGVRYALATVGQLPTRFSSAKGWKRRVVPLPTTGTQKEDINLGQDLENCLGDIISWALAQDKEARNYILMNPEKVHPGVEEYFRDAAVSSSSALAFIEECLTPVDPEVDDIESSQTVDEGRIFAAYKSYCAATGCQPMKLDSFKHELRQALPLNWVDRRGKGGKIPRRFVYMALKESAFEFGDIGVTCNLSNRGYDGLSEFREWAIKFGGLHPYGPDELATMGAESEPTPPPAAAPPDVTPMPEPVAPPQPAPELSPIAPDQGCRDGDGNVIHAWITPGKPEWWQAFEQRLIEATTIEQLQEAKAKTSASRRTQVMNAWSSDGRYEWLKAKAARLEAEAMEVEQGELR